MQQKCKEKINQIIFIFIAMSSCYRSQKNQWIRSTDSSSYFLSSYWKMTFTQFLWQNLLLEMWKMKKRKLQSVRVGVSDRFALSLSLSVSLCFSLSIFLFQTIIFSARQYLLSLFMFTLVFVVVSFFLHILDFDICFDCLLK